MATTVHVHYNSDLKTKNHQSNILSFVIFRVFCWVGEKTTTCKKPSAAYRKVNKLLKRHKLIVLIVFLEYTLGKKIDIPTSLFS